MRIAYVLHQFMPYYNSGTEQYVYHLAKSLEARGHEVRIFCFEPNFERDLPFTGLSVDIFDGLTVTRLSGWNGQFPNHPLAQYYNPFYGKLFGEFLEDEGIELVHFFHTASLSTALVEEARLADLPVVINLMDFWFLCPNVQLLKTHDGALCDGPEDYKECIGCLAPKDANYQWIEPYVSGPEAEPLVPEIYEDGRWDFLSSSDNYHRVAAMAARPHFIRSILDKTDRIISPSDFLKTFFVRNGYRPDHIDVVRYGIDAEGLGRVRRDEAPGGLRIGYMGTISPHKGLDVLLKAFRELDGDDISLEIHGDLGAFPDFSERVRELAGDDPRIRFHGRFESPKLAEVLSGMDVMVVPSMWYENTPFVILEGLASGTPVIASDLGGLAELVEDGENGLLFEAGSVTDLRRQLSRLVEDRDLVNRLRPDPAEARSLEDNVEDFLHLYETLKSKGREPGGTDGSPALSGPEEQSMDAEKEALKEKVESLSRQTHHLTSQIFHMINMNMGFIRKISELERVVDDRMFLEESRPSEEALKLPRDLSPSTRRRLIQLEQLKVILERRNDLVAELERQVNEYRAQEERYNDAIRALKDHAEQKQERIDVLETHEAQLTEMLNQVWSNPAYRTLSRIRRIFRRGGGHDG